MSKKKYEQGLTKEQILSRVYQEAERIVSKLKKIIDRENDLPASQNPYSPSGLYDNLSTISAYIQALLHEKDIRKGQTDKRIRELEIEVDYKQDEKDSMKKAYEQRLFYIEKEFREVKRILSKEKNQ